MGERVQLVIAGTDGTVGGPEGTPISESVAKGSQFYGNIENFGAVSGQDCTAAIEAAQKEVAKLPGSYGVFFPAGTWIYGKTLRFEVPWLGVPRRSILKQASSFTYVSGTWALQNKNFATTYGGAASVAVQGLDMVFENTSGTEKQGLGLANVASGQVSDCHLSTEGSGLIAPLDVFAAARNLRFVQVQGLNSTEAAHGGCWVRNVCAPSSEAAARTNATENITFEDCVLGTSTGDEALAIFSAGGMVRHVRVTKSKIEALLSGTSHNHIASTVLGTSEGEHAYSAVEDVLWDDCVFLDTTGNLAEGHPVMTFGVAADAGLEHTVLQNVRHRDCTFVVQSPETAIASLNIPNNYEGASSGNAAIRPKINAEGSTGAVEGLVGFPVVVAPEMVGNISARLRECADAYVAAVVPVGQTPSGTGLEFVLSGSAASPVLESIHFEGRPL